MKQFTFLLPMLFILCVITGCDSVFEPAEPEYAPDNIYNKTLEFNGSSYSISGFKSTGKCTVEMASWETITKDPTYTYKKQSGNVAEFHLEYSDRSQLVSSMYTLSDMVYDLTLTFTSESGGTLTGTVKSIKTGGNSGKSFTIDFEDKPFDLY